MSRVLVLRPEPGVSATVRRARELGLDAISAPRFELQPLAWQAPVLAGFDGLLLTSANAVRFGGEQLRALRHLPAYAVGDSTAEAARAAGITVRAAGDSGVEGLLCSIPADLRLLHLCGEDRREPASAPQRILAIAVYRASAIEAPDLSAARGAVVLVHSPRAGRRLAELVDDRASIAVAAISPAAADAAGQGWQAVEAAERPDDDAVLALAARLCNKPAPE
jgi:uroporphyrinogen-III synthase